MRMEVRNPGGTLLGWLDVDVALLRDRQYINFARAKDSRHWGRGVRVLPEEATDLSFTVVRMRVDLWITPPTFGTNGCYYPGSVVHILRTDEPYDVLRDIRGWDEAGRVCS